ncbi:MAG: leucine rich repeat containing 1 [Pseudomonadota bacterium]|jgi:Leucine-rich repeat (LRR) protein
MGNAISWKDYLGEMAHEIARSESGSGEDTTDDGFESNLDAWVKAGGPGECRAAAGDLIRTAKKTAAQELNLGDGLGENFSLRTLPECIGDLTHIRVLRLVGNQLVRLPASIGKLSRLQALHLFGNRLEELPSDICLCADLERLYLAGNRLKTLPEDIGALHKLEVLSLPGNRLTRLPESIGTLEALTELYLFDNPLLLLPRSIGRLKKLERVLLGGSHLAAQFEQMTAILPPRRTH